MNPIVVSALALIFISSCMPQIGDVKGDLIFESTEKIKNSDSQGGEAVSEPKPKITLTPVTTTDPIQTVDELSTIVNVYKSGGTEVSSEQLFNDIKSNILPKCTGCHSQGGSRSQSDFNLASSQDFIDAGYIIAGDPQNSPLYNRLKGANVGVATENMPYGEDLTASEVKQIREWINSLNQSSGKEIIQIYSQNFQIISLSLSESGVSASINCRGGEGYNYIFYQVNNNQQRTVARSGQETCLINQSNQLSLVSGSINTSKVRLEILYQNTVVAMKSADYKVSNTASCELQNELISTGLRRLSTSQVINTLEEAFNIDVKSLFTEGFGDSSQTIGMNELRDRLILNSSKLNRMYELSSEIINTLLSQDQTIKACASTSSSNCLSSILEDKILKLWRRPISYFSQEVQEMENYANQLSSNSDKLKFYLAALMMSDRFLFRSEIGVLDNSTGIANLNNYEIINLLSYSIWDGPPDSTLYALAAQSQPLSQTAILSQVNRMVSSDKAKQSFVKILKDYLKIDFVTTKEKDSAFNFTSEKRAALIKSFELGILDTLNMNSPYINMFKGNNYFVNSTVADIFGLNASNYQESFKKVALSSMRYGALNHPAFLTAHSKEYNTGIVKRGVFTLEQILCVDLPDVSTVPDSLELNIDPNSISTREYFELSHSSQDNCKSCHKDIDPAGYGYEDFDQIGQYREYEQKNTPIAIDSSGSLYVNDFSLSFNNSREYSQALAQTENMNFCISKRFLEYYLGESFNDNACEVSKYRTLISSAGDTSISLLRSLVQLESFYKRSKK